MRFPNVPILAVRVLAGLGAVLPALPAVAQPFILPLQQPRSSEASPPAPSPTPVAPPQADAQPSPQAGAPAEADAQPSDPANSSEAANGANPPRAPGQ